MSQHEMKIATTNYESRIMVNKMLTRSELKLEEHVRYEVRGSEL